MLNTTTQTEIIRTDNFDASIVLVKECGTVTAMAGIIIDRKKKNYFVGVDAKVSAFTERASIKFELLDMQFEIGGSVNAYSAGYQLGAGLDNGVFYFKNGFAAFLGYDYYIRIKFA